MAQPGCPAFEPVGGLIDRPLVTGDHPEQKARVTYDNILRLSDDPDVNDVIKSLREREIVHFLRFGEAIELLHRKLNQRNVYAMKPAIDL